MSIYRNWNQYNKMKIGKIEINKGLLLAPMEGVTDLSFRIICRRLGADIVYTEFIASEALIRDVKKSLDKMKIMDEERPVAVQIFGSNVNSMVQSAKMVEDSGADFLDINFGCWVKKVVNNDSGAAFLKDPHRLADMADAVASSVTIPVTAKTRLGWDSDSIVIEETSRLLEQTKIAGLTVHCRTRQMGMKGDADWSWIDRIRPHFSKALILNGDVRTPVDAQRAFDSTSCDAVMIGRAAIGNPFIFFRTRQMLDNGSVTAEPTIDERIGICLQHFGLDIEFKGLQRGILEFRKHYAGYLKGMFSASAVRQKLVLMTDKNEIEETLRSYLDSLHKHNITSIDYDYPSENA